MAAGTLTLSGLAAPTDVWVTGPFSVSGSVDNSDPTNSPPTVQTQLVIDSSLSTTKLTGAMFTGSTCDVPGAAAAQPVDVTDDSAGKITLTCHQDFLTNTASSPFDFQIALNAPPGDTDSVPVTVNVVDSGTTTVEATAALPSTVTLHPAPQLTGLTGPTDAWVKATAFTISGGVANDGSDLSGVQPAARMALVLDTSSVGPTPPASSAFAGSTCDVPGGAGQSAAALDSAAGQVTLTCPQGSASSSSSSSFTFHVQMRAAADDTGTLAGTVKVLDSTTVEATAALPSTITLRAAPSLSVTAPTDPVGTNAVSFSGHIDNTGGVPQPQQPPLRLGVVASGVPGLTPSEIHLQCGGNATDVSFAIDSNQNLVGYCPAGSAPGDGFTVGAASPTALAFQLSFDNGAPGGQLNLSFALDATSGGQTLSPDLATSGPVGPVTVFPANTVTVSASPPSVLATGSAPKTYTGHVDNTSAGHTYTSVHPAVVAGWTGSSALPTSSLQLSCDGGGQWASFAASSVSPGHPATATCANSTSISAPYSAPINFAICIDGNAPTGTLTLQTTLVNDNGGLQVAAETNPDQVQVIAGPASTGSCRNAAQTFVWTGDAAPDSDWANGANWDQGTAPGSSDVAVVPANATITGISGHVGTLLISGGSDPSSAPQLSLAGNLTVSSLLRLSGFVKFLDSGTTSGLISNGQFTTAASTNLELADDHINLFFPATATFSIGDTTSLHRPATLTGGNPAISVSGVFLPGKSMTIDKIDLDLVTASASIQTAGSTLTLTGPSTSTWTAGAAITDVSVPGGGAVSLGQGATLATTGTLTVQHNGILRLLSGSVVDGGAGLTLAGPGSLDWQGGALTGTITLDSSLTASGAGAGASIADAGVVTNLGTLKLTVTRGQSYEFDGQLDNKGTIVISPGAVITSLAAQSMFTNEAGATLALASGTSQGVGLLSGVHLRNFGAITIPTDETLRDEGGSVLLGANSTVIGGGVPTTTSGSSAPPAGALALGAGATGEVAGTVTLKSDAVLALDGGTTGGAATPPALTADSGAALAAASSATTTDGAFHWCFGSVAGSLAVGKNISTEVGPGNVSGSCRIGNPVTVNLAGTITASGPASVNNSSFVEAAHARAVFGGNTTFGMTTSFSPANSSLDDQAVVVDKNGSVDIPNLASAPGISQSSNITFAIPLTVNGSLVNEGKMSATAPVTNNGSVSLTKSVTTTAVVNAGTWFIGAATLTTTAGYTQQMPAGATASTPIPVTRFTDPSGILTTTALTLTSGGLVGGGTVNATDVTVGAGFVRPSFSFGAPTTMTINAPVHLSKTSDMQTVIYGPTSRDVIKITKPLSLSGKMTGFTSSSYTPKYLQTVSGVITFPSHTGGFTDSAWGGTPNGLGWKPRTLATTAKQVDLQLVDVAPPSLGIASIAAFTEFATQRVTYFGVDNRTGVQSYDVRWRNASPTKTYGSWHYPTGWQRTTATSQTLGSLVVGNTYCFSVRTRDKAGNTTPWSVPQCAARMFDDHALTAHGAWTRPGKKPGFYFKTYSQTAKLGASLTKSGTFTRIGVIAQVCPKCGSMAIYSGKTLIKTWSLRSSQPRLASFVTKVLTSRTATVRIKSMRSGKAVIIDAFGLMR